MGLFALPYGSILKVPTNTILGRKSSGTGVAEALTGSDVATILGLGSSAYEDVEDIAPLWGNIAGTLSNQTDLNAALAAKLNLTGGTLTGNLQINPTWNNVGTVFTGLGLNVTNTASAAGSLLLDLKVGATSFLNVTKAGALFASSGITIGTGASADSAGVTLTTSGGTHRYHVTTNAAYIDSYNRTIIRNNGTTVFDSNGGSPIGSTVPGLPRGVYVAALSSGYVGLILRAAASQTAHVMEMQTSAGVIKQAIGPNMEWFGYNTRTDASNYERGYLRWASNVFEIGTEALGTGSGRTLLIKGTATILDSVSATYMRYNGNARLTCDGSGTVKSSVTIEPTATGTYGLGQGGTRWQAGFFGGNTVTASTPMLDLSQTWNSGAVTFTGLSVAITNTASAAASKIADFTVGGASVFTFGRSGALTISNAALGDVTGPWLTLSNDNLATALQLNSVYAGTNHFYNQLLSTGNTSISGVRGRSLLISAYIGSSGDIATDLTTNAAVMIDASRDGVASITDRKLFGVYNLGAERFAVTQAGIAEAVSGFYLRGATTGMSATASSVLTFWLNGTNVFGTGNAGQLNIRSFSSLGWVSGTDTTASPDLALYREAGDILGQHRTTSPQTYRIYNTRTDASNYERGYLGWSSGFLNLGTEALGTGVARGLRIYTGGVLRATFTNTGGFLWERPGSGDTAFIEFRQTSAGDDAAYLVGGSAGGMFILRSGTASNADGTECIGMDAATGYVGIGKQDWRSAPPASLLSIWETWNNVATTFCAFKLRIVDTTSHANSLLADWQVGGVSRFTVGKTGTTLIAADTDIDVTFGRSKLGSSISSDNLYLAHLDQFAASTYALRQNTSGDTWLNVPTARTLRLSLGETAEISLSSAALNITPVSNLVQVYNGTNPQTLHVFNTRTDASNFERGSVLWSSNFFRLTTSAGGTGTVRNIGIYPGGSAAIGLTLYPNGSSEVSVDTDSNHSWGRMRAGSSIVTDTMYLSHYDHFSSTNYALRQSSVGATTLNAATGQAVALAVNNVTQLSLTATEITLSSGGNWVQLRNGVNPQGFYLFNTYTDGSNFERGTVRWSANILQIGTHNAGTGVARALQFLTGNTAALTIDTSGHTTLESAKVLRFSGRPTIKPSATDTLQVLDSNETLFRKIQGKLTTDETFVAGSVTPTGFLILSDAAGNQYKVASSPFYALDYMSPAEGEWSFARRLREDYTGPIGQLYRMNDAATQDIYGSGVLGAADPNEVRTFGGWNLFSYSEFPNGVTDAPTRSNITAAAGVDFGPLGVIDGIYFLDDAVDRYAYKTFSTTVGLTYTFSAYIKMDDGLAPSPGTSAGSGDFAFVIGGNLNSNVAVVELVSGTVYRVSATRTVTGSGASGIVKYTAQTARGFTVTGYQLELASAVSTYQETTTYGAGAVKWKYLYDQSGNARHFEQTNAVRMPYAAVQGVPVTEDGRLAALFVVTESTRMEVPASTAMFNPWHTTGGSVVAVAHTNDIASSKWLIGNKNSSANTGMYILRNTSERVVIDVGRLDIAGTATNGSSISIDHLGSTNQNLHILVTQLDPDNATAANRVFSWVNGNALSTSNVVTGTPYAENAALNMTLGAAPSGGGAWDGTISEVLMPLTLSTANRKYLEKDAASFWSSITYGGTI